MFCFDRLVPSIFLGDTNEEEMDGEIWKLTGEEYKEIRDVLAFLWLGI